MKSVTVRYKLVTCDISQNNEGEVKQMQGVGSDYKGKRGRPTKTWNNEIGQVLQNRNLCWRKVTTFAHYRKTWKDLTPASIPYGRRVRIKLSTFKENWKGGPKKSQLILQFKRLCISYGFRVLNGVHGKSDRRVHYYYVSECLPIHILRCCESDIVMIVLNSLQARTS